MGPRRALRENGTIYTIDELLLRELRPDVILTQKLCDVCAVGYGTVARLAETLPDPPRVVNLEPSSLSDIFDDIRRVAEVCGVSKRADRLVAKLSERVEAVRRRADRISNCPRCFLMEWVDPPFCSGHWGPELLEIAGGHDPLGRKHQPSVQIEWQQVLEARPEIIVLALCGYGVDLARRDYELLRRFPGFDSIPVARIGEIYLVDASAFFARPGPRIVDSLELLAGILHPEEFPEFAPRGSEDARVVRVGRMTLGSDYKQLAVASLLGRDQRSRLQCLRAAKHVPQFVFGAFQNTLLLFRKRFARAIDVEVEHRHR